MWWHVSETTWMGLSTDAMVNGHHGTTVFEGQWHYNEVIMGVIASQITSLTIVYSTVYSDADQRKHQSSASLAFVWLIPRTNGQWRGKRFNLMTSSFAFRTSEKPVIEPSNVPRTIMNECLPNMLTYLYQLELWSNTKEVSLRPNAMVHSYQQKIAFPIWEHLFALSGRLSRQSNQYRLVSQPGSK